MSTPKRPRISGLAWDETGRRASLVAFVAATIAPAAALLGLTLPALMAIGSALAFAALSLISAPAARRARRMEAERRKYLRRLIDAAAHDSIERRADR